MTQFQYSGVVYPNAIAYYDAIAEDWLCAGALTEGEIKSTFSAMTDRTIAEECYDSWRLEADANVTALVAAFGRLRTQYDDRWIGEAAFAALRPGDKVEVYQSNCRQNVDVGVVVTHDVTGTQLLVDLGGGKRSYRLRTSIRAVL